MTISKKIDIIKRLIADIDEADFDAHDWLAKANNFLNKVFDDSDVRVHQLKSVLSRPKYMLSGYVVEEVQATWKKRLQSYIEELELEDDEKESVASQSDTYALASIANDYQFIDDSRIEELRTINSDQFDMSKLVRLCEELNSNYSNKNYYSVALLGRAIIDHVPPIFGYEKLTK